MNVSDIKAKIDSIVNGIKAVEPYWKRAAVWLGRKNTLKPFIRELYFFGGITEANRDEILEYIDSIVIGE